MLYQHLRRKEHRYFGSEAMIRHYSHLQPGCFEKHLAAVPDVLAGIAAKSPLKTGDSQRKLLITKLRP